MRKLTLLKLLSFIFLWAPHLDGQDYEAADIECPYSLNNNPDNGQPVAYGGKEFVLGWFATSSSFPLPS